MGHVTDFEFDECSGVIQKIIVPGIGGKNGAETCFPCAEPAHGGCGGIFQRHSGGKKQVHTCPVCQNLTDREVCPICDDDTRDKSVICVVAEPKDVIAMERSREFRGVTMCFTALFRP